MVSYADSIHFIDWLFLSTVLYLHFISGSVSVPLHHSSVHTFILRVRLIMATVVSLFAFHWLFMVSLSKIRETIALIYYILLMLSSERFGFSLRNSLLWFSASTWLAHMPVPRFPIGRESTCPACCPSSARWQTSTSNTWWKTFRAKRSSRYRRRMKTHDGRVAAARRPKV